MLAHSVGSALLSNETMNYGSVIAGALLLVCDICLLLLLDTSPSHRRSYLPGRVRRLSDVHDRLDGVR